MSTDVDRATRPRVLPWLIGIVAAVVAAVVVFAVLDSNQNDAPPPAGGQGSVTKLTLSAPQGRCVVPDATTLGRAGVAFSGSVVSVSKGLVTLRPSAWYAGDHTDLVTVEQVDPGMTDLVGAVDFRPGKDYLVAANDGAVMVCGFSGEKSSELDALYQEAFAGGTA
jgi:hypothetical protein